MSGPTSFDILTFRVSRTGCQNRRLCISAALLYAEKFFQSPQLFLFVSKNVLFTRKNPIPKYEIFVNANWWTRTRSARTVFDRFDFGGGGGSRTRVRKHFNETFSGRRRLFRRSYSSRSLSRRQAVTRVRSGELHDVWHGQSLPYSHLPLNDALPGPRSLRVGRLLLIKQQYRCCLIYKLPVLWRSGSAAR